MPTLAERSIQLILCDPPYGTTLNNWDKILPFAPVWNQYSRLLAPGGCVVLFGSQPFTAALIMSNPRWFKYELIWDKNKCGSPGLAKIRPMKTHENILVFSPEKTLYNPQMEKGEPYARKTDKPEGYVGRCNNHKYGLKPRQSFENTGTRYPKSVLRISRDFSAQQQVHPTQKPVPLLEWLVKTYSNEGDTVLDNAMGSGSTGVAAIRHGRKFIGMESDYEMFLIASERIKAESACAGT
jgi:site-specific DNA-methyltransferase (adenine-specific)